MRSDGAHPEVTRTTCRKYVTQSQWAKIDEKIRCDAGHAHAVLQDEIGSPIHVNVLFIAQQAAGGVGGYQHELFFHQQIYFQARTMLGSVRDGNVDQAGSHLVDQILRHVDMDAKRYISKRTTHP